MLWRCYRSSSRTLPTVCRQFRENTARCWQTDRPWTVNSTRIDRWDEANAVQRRGENIKEVFWVFVGYSLHKNTWRFCEACSVICMRGFDVKFLLSFWLCRWRRNWTWLMTARRCLNWLDQLWWPRISVRPREMSRNESNTSGRAESASRSRHVFIIICIDIIYI